MKNCTLYGGIHATCGRVTVDPTAPTWCTITTLLQKFLLEVSDPAIVIFRHDFGRNCELVTIFWNLEQKSWECGAGYGKTEYGILYGFRDVSDVSRPIFEFPHFSTIFMQLKFWLSNCELVTKLPPNHQKPEIPLREEFVFPSGHPLWIAFWPVGPYQLRQPPYQR